MDTILKLILTLLFIPLFIRLSKWIHNHVRNYIILGRLPGPPRGGILIGNMSYLQAPPEVMFRRFREAAKNFYPAYKFYAFHRSSVHLLKPEDCELILSNPIHNEKGYVYKLLHKWLKFGLLTSSGTKWQIRRKILTPAFHFNILQQFIGVFNDETEKLVEVLKKESEKSQINVTPFVMQYTLKIIAETAMGTKLNFESEEEKSYKKAIYDIGRIIIHRFNHPWCIESIGNIISPYFFEEIRVTKLLHNFTKSLIKEKEKHFNYSELPKEEHDVYKGKKRLAMLDLLLNAKRENMIDDEGIQEEVDTFMFEGHDTTAVALCFMLMLFANHKNVQDLIYQEMVDVLGDVRKKPNYNDLQNLKYMERCIKESLRLYPSVWFISRTLGEDVEITSGHLLPKNAMLIIHIYDIHHNPDIYPDPEIFDPDRFLPENCQNRHPFAYLPFSAGPRNCVGQKFAMIEMKVAISAILANFRLEPIDTPETIEPIIDLVLRTKEGIKIRLVQRELIKL